MSVPSTKHFLNSPSSLVLDSLQGLCAANPRIVLDAQNKIVSVSTPDKSKVSIICGGGSGHEPAHAGFVGAGMLTAAVCGNIFASPNASQVQRALDLVESHKGYDIIDWRLTETQTLIIVKNYTGDVLNFGLAKEKYSALHPEKADHLKFLIVGDDVAVGKSQGKIVGRRGLAGTVFVYKIAGALAHRGAHIDQIYFKAKWIAENVATIGVGLEHTHVPGTAQHSSHLSPSEIEIGMGIHNESGYRRLSPIPPLSALMAQLLELLTSTTDHERSYVPFKGKDNIVLLVNNLGGVSNLELGAIVREAREAAEAKGFEILRLLSGTLMTSLNMPGFSLTVLRLPSAQEPNAPNSSHILSLLDDPPDVPGWSWSSATQVVSSTDQSVTGTHPVQLEVPEPDIFVNRIQKACNALIMAEPEITRMDTVAGDGDCGLTLKAGAEAVLAKVLNRSIDGNDVITSVIAIASAAEDAMGGTSGALYSIFFSGLAQGLQAYLTQDGSKVTPSVWAQAAKFALNKLYNYTHARPPSRTLMDPLAVFVTSFASEADLNAAVKAAGNAAEATMDLDAKAGRSAYIEGSRLKDLQIPDPGAWGVKVILENLVE